MNYFELFGLSPRFELEVAELSATYQALQRQFHPDKYADASERDRLLAVSKTAEINDAFQTLKAPLSRAEYLLSLRNIDIRAEQQTFQDPMFLMQQMQLREQLEEIPDADDVDSAIADLEAQTLGLKQELMAQLGHQLSQQTEAEDLMAADTIRKLKFIEKLAIELERLEDSLFDD